MNRDTVCAIPVQSGEVFLCNLRAILKQDHISKMYRPLCPRIAPVNSGMWTSAPEKKRRFSPRQPPTEPARAARRHHTGTADQILPYFAHDLDGLGVVKFSVDLSRGWRTVPQDHTGRVNAELLPQKRCRIVAELIRAPTVFSLPFRQFSLLFICKSVLPFLLGLTFAPGQWIWQRESFVAGAADSASVSVRCVSEPR